MWDKIASLFMGDGGIIGKVLDKVLVDATKKAEIAAAFVQEMMAQRAALDMAAADIIKAEATSGGVLPRSRRPTVLLTFMGVIVSGLLGGSGRARAAGRVAEAWGV